MKMDNVISADRLRKAAMDPLPGQNEDPEEPVEINGEPEWEVEEILASRVHRKKLQYKASWVGHDPDDQWYDAANFIGAPYLIQKYHKDYPENPGPPARLSEWIRA